jgi:hypothetical protein
MLLQQVSIQYALVWLDIGLTIFCFISIFGKCIGVGSSGFSFMGTGGPVVGNSPAGGARPANNNSNSNDSFDFVSQAMRGMN